MHIDSKLATSILLGVVLIAFFAATACVGGGVDKAPRFHLQKTSVDLGEFLEGEDVNYVFKVRNTGTADLEIVNVRPG
jgi:hypothetical protein